MNFSLPPRVLSFPDIFHSLACRPLVLSLYFLVIRQPEKNISHCRFLSFSILSAFGFQGFLCSAFLSHLGSESETIFTCPAVSPFPFYFLSFLFLIFWYLQYSLCSRICQYFFGFISIFICLYFLIFYCY